MRLRPVRRDPLAAVVYVVNRGRAVFESGQQRQGGLLMEKREGHGHAAFLARLDGVKAGLLWEFIYVDLIRQSAALALVSDFCLTASDASVFGTATSISDAESTSASVGSLAHAANPQKFMVFTGNKFVIQG
jgi:hypothetical protein